MKIICFHIKSYIAIDEAWEELESWGIQPIYSSEDAEGHKEIYGHLDSSLKLDIFSHSFESIEAIEEAILQDIDWSQQWSQHASNFQEGYLHLDLNCDLRAEHVFKPHNKVKLKPGPGFGDLSHPTTRLILKMMPSVVLNKIVIDIGCGSGVLTLAALGHGALFAYGIDIDPLAVAHSKENAALNHMETQTTFGLPEHFHFSSPPPSAVILMNMIRSEQVIAWESIKDHLRGIPGECLISGIQKEEEKKYLQLIKKWKWTLLDKIEENGWLGFKLIRT